MPQKTQLSRRENSVVPEPAVTIIVVPRERFSYSRTSLESIFAYTDQPFRMIYVDGGSPKHVKNYLEMQAKAQDFKLIRTEHYLSPNQARNIGLREADTKYVVFVDNDVIVASGWLPALLQCAEETNASLVGPLYCIGQPAHQVIHMAGGDAAIREEQGRRRLYEKHRLCDQLVADVRPQLRREPCELIEFHCMFARRDVLLQIGLLDEGMISTREHVDVCLAVREMGGTVWFEPSAVVTNVPAQTFAWSDLPYYLLRWSDAWGQATLQHFERKRNLDASAVEVTNFWLRPHRQLALLPVRNRLRRYLGAKVGDRLVDSLESFLARKALTKGLGPRTEQPSGLQQRVQVRPEFPQGIGRGH
jgi:GT2 family glycosyltransferase